MKHHREHIFIKNVAITLSIGLGSLSILFAPTIVSAASTVSILPSSGSYDVGDTFKVTLKIEDGSTAFNAAKADITLSSNIAVENVTIGNCNFAFVKTPTVSSPSFSGTMLGTSSKDCTAYTLQLKAVSSGTGSISITNGSVKSFAGSTELFSSSRNGSYTLTASSVPEATVTPTPPTENMIATGDATYEVELTVVDDENNPIPNAVVTIDDGTKKVTDENGIVTFPAVPGGIRKVVANEASGDFIAQQIINLSGEQKTMALGISQQKEKPTRSFPWMLLAIILVPLLAGGVVLVRRTHLFRK